jgi:hypothetical protein
MRAAPACVLGCCMEERERDGGATIRCRKFLTGTTGAPAANLSAQGQGEKRTAGGFVSLIVRSLRMWEGKAVDCPRSLPHRSTSQEAKTFF